MRHTVWIEKNKVETLVSCKGQLIFANFEFDKRRPKADICGKPICCIGFFWPLSSAVIGLHEDEAQPALLDNKNNNLIDDFSNMLQYQMVQATRQMHLTQTALRASYVGCSWQGVHCAPQYKTWSVLCLTAGLSITFFLHIPAVIGILGKSFMTNNTSV